MFKTNYSAYKKIGGGKTKFCGSVFPNALPWLRPAWHSYITPLHQKVTTKINLRSFFDLVPRHTILMIHKTNISPVYYCGSFIYDNVWLSQTIVR